MAIDIQLNEPVSQLQVAGVEAVCVTVNQKRKSFKIDYQKYGIDGGGNKVYIGEVFSAEVTADVSDFLVWAFEQDPLVKSLVANTSFDGSNVSFNTEAINQEFLALIDGWNA